MVQAATKALMMSVRTARFNLPALVILLEASGGTLEEVRIRYLGRKAELPNLLRHVGDLGPAERAATGKAANEARKVLEVLIERRSAELASQELEERLTALRAPYGNAEAFGVTEMLDPRTTRRVICDYVEQAQEVLASQLGPKVTVGIRP